MVKIRRRFMMFNRDGLFIDEVEFCHQEPEDLTADYPSSLMTLKKFRAHREQVQQYEYVMTNIEKLKLRRRNDPICDFYGNSYDFKDADPPPPLSDANKMELLNMSNNNKWFLFFNRMTLDLSVFELREKTEFCENHSFNDLASDLK